MNHTHEPNESIGCTVTDCRYHDRSDYCTLNHIDVVKNDTADDVSQECTDCGSYVYKESQS